MKNQIMYFYDLEINNIMQKNDSYYINDNYYLDIYDLQDNKFLEYYLSNNNYFKVQRNKFNQIYSVINNKKYILLLFNESDREININDVLIYNMVSESKSDWINKWPQKIDYIEYLINNNQKKYNLIYIYSYYYIGLAENALQLCTNELVKTYIQHYRTYYNQRIYDYVSPKNIVLDTKIRDLCEYLKSSFFNSNIIYPDIKIDEKEKQMFLARMLYPTYFFDDVQTYKEININKYVPNITKYEKYIIEICSLYNIKIDIEWLKKI